MEIIIILNNFSFSNNVFKTSLLQRCQNASIMWERVNPLPHMMNFSKNDKTRPGLSEENFLKKLTIYLKFINNQQQKSFLFTT